MLSLMVVLRRSLCPSVALVVHSIRSILCNRLACSSALVPVIENTVRTICVSKFLPCLRTAKQFCFDCPNRCDCAVTLAFSREQSPFGSWMNLTLAFSFQSVPINASYPRCGITAQSSSVAAYGPNLTVTVVLPVGVVFPLASVVIGASSLFLLNFVVKREFLVDEGCVGTRVQQNCGFSIVYVSFHKTVARLLCAHDEVRLFFGYILRLVLEIQLFL